MLNKKEIEEKHLEVNFTKCQMDKIIEAYNNGKEVEFEAFSPYLADYNTATGEIWPDKLMNEDAIGLAISKMLREKFSKARLISLYDEYNSGMPDSSDYYGAPTANASQLSFSDKIKEKFKQSLEKFLKQKGVIRENDKEKENYLFVSESSKITAAERLVGELEAKGKIKKDGQAIYFLNDESENPDYKEIILRAKNGRWLCEALDASSYLDKANLKITHLVVLSNDFKEQQDKVWEILKTLGIRPTNYHNIFYDKNASPEEVTRIIKEEIEKYSPTQ